MDADTVWKVILPLERGNEKCTKRKKCKSSTEIFQNKEAIFMKISFDFDHEKPNKW